jgi:hypothetical protein
MPVPLVISILAGISAVLAIASTVTSAVISNKQADNQERLAKAQFTFEKKEADEQARQAAEAAAAERLAIAQEAAQAKGVAKTAGLAEGSLRNFILDIQRKEGRSNAILDRNLELVASRQRSNIEASSLSLSGKLLDVDSNRPNAAVLGLQLGSQVAGSYASYKTATKPDTKTAE